MEEKKSGAKSRMSRVDFWKRWALATAALIILAIVITVTNVPRVILNLLLFAYDIVVVLWSIQRIHDVNRSGWNVFVPVYSFILLIRDGTVGSNYYGNDPHGRSGEDLSGVKPKFPWIGVLITVIILAGTFALVFFPKSSALSTKASASECTVVLKSITVNEEAVRSEKGAYETMYQLIADGFSMPESKYFDYFIENLTDSTFTARAIVKKTFGRVPAGAKAEIDQSGKKQASPELLKYIHWNSYGN
jgi:hypothetical protein